MQLNARQQQLRERDVRKLSPDLDANTFMRLYMESNFPQTASLPSPQQMQRGLDTNNLQDPIKLAKKPLSGTKYDNPGGV
jgi:transcription initiation factor TFIID subunit TAF12